MIAVLGLMRTVKSSSVLSTLNSLNVNCIFIDVRKIDHVSKKVPAEKLYEELYSGLLKLSKKRINKELTGNQVTS